MTEPVYGRGRPPVFDAERQQAFLELVAAGTRIGEAAAKTRIARRTVNALARRDDQFAERLQAAKAQGRSARIPHGTPGGYDNWDCRCGPCTKASSAARARRGGRRRPDEEGEVIQWPEQPADSGESAHSFSLAKVS
ncbi:hypothetical protein ACFV27_36840 [Streptomyces antimycoticus]|uniref:hypothetical protein n=1 Tax=Streptomyces antimycoticus TaxID=68175 RepID=UPI0036B4F9B7